MMISQTPYRVSFGGGGTDLPAFCNREYGAVLSCAIDRHVYVTVHPRFEPGIRISYSKTEVAETVDSIEHELVREAMRSVGISEPLEIMTIGDVPAGTGLGSSSSLTVGLLSALHGYVGTIKSAKDLAEQACRIEIDVLGKPIGRQDQYVAAHGGLNYMRFNPDGTVWVDPVNSPDAISELERHALMIYTGGHRDANEILTKQSGVTKQRLDTLRAMRNLADKMRDKLASGLIEEFARLLHDGWMLKRSLGCGISNNWIDHQYSIALRAGALGGKLLGAGGSGFLFLLAYPHRHDAIRTALGNPREIPFRVSPHGVRVIFSN